MIVGCLAAKKGFGLNIYDIMTDDLVTALEIFYSGELVYVTLLGLCKSSVLLFYLRIFPYKGACLTRHMVLVAFGICTIVYQFLIVFQCMPISYNWEGRQIWATRKNAWI
jgi:hypothetical protein